jgi:hypothetical protein
MTRTVSDDVQPSGSGLLPAALRVQSSGRGAARENRECGSCPVLRVHTFNIDREPPPEARLVSPCGPHRHPDPRSAGPMPRDLGTRTGRAVTGLPNAGRHRRGYRVRRSRPCTVNTSDWCSLDRRVQRDRGPNGTSPGAGIDNPHCCEWPHEGLSSARDGAGDALPTRGCFWTTQTAPSAHSTGTRAHPLLVGTRSITLAPCRRGGLRL